MSQLVRETEPPITRTALQPNTTTQSPTPLRDGLRKAGITPFTKESVVAYKRAKIKELHLLYPMTPWNRAVVRFLAKRAELNSWLEICVLFGAIGSWGLLLVATLETGLRNGFPAGLDVFMRFIPFVLFFSLTFAYCLYIGGKPVPEWERVRYEFVPSDKIPERIHTTRDEVQFHVEDAKFDIERVTFLSAEDPFLIAKNRHEEYYIDVWDEKDFKRR